MMLHRTFLTTCRRVHICNIAAKPLQRNKHVPSMAMTTGPENLEEDVAYKGTFGGTLKLLRRISLCSATLSITSLPMMMVLNGSTPTLPQLIVIGTAVTASLGSTLFLKLMSFPYVTKFDEIPSADEKEVAFKDRRFIAYRISMLGMEYGTEVALRDVEPVKVTEHPFASFKAKGDKFFIFHKMVKEEKLQNHLLEIQERKIG